MYIILKFLLASIFCHYDYLCETLHPYNRLHAIPCLMETLTSLLRDLVYKFPWYYTKKHDPFDRNPPLEPMVCTHGNIYVIRLAWVFCKYRALVQELNWSGYVGGWWGKIQLM